MNARAWLLVGALILALPAPALAENPSERAAELFREGREAIQREDFAAACPKFEESARLDAAPGTILNLAVCDERLGRLGRALTNFNVVIALLPPDDERVPFAKEHAEALEPRVGRLILVLPDDTPAGAKVLRDGEELAPADLGTADAVDPGSHEVILRVPGQEDVQFSISLSEGEHRTLVLKPRSQPGAGLSRKTIGFIVGGVGAASLAAGLVTGALVLDKKGTVDASCHGTSECDTQEGVDAASAGATLSTISTITFLVGVAALGAGVALVLTSDDSPATTAIAPAVMPGGGGLLVRRRF